MVNRSIEAKKLKMRKKGKYRMHSGGLTRLDDKGHFIKWSNQVMNVGRGPSAELMQEYYERVNSYDQALPATLGITLDRPASLTKEQLYERYSKIIDGVPKELNVVFESTGFYKLRLFFAGNQHFFVEEDNRKKVLRKSIIYSSRNRANEVYKNKKITWVERYDISSP